MGRPPSPDRDALETSHCDERVNETRNPPGARRVRLGSAPSVSVVVASSGPRERLEALLAEVEALCGEIGAEIVVARAAAPAELEALRAAHPRVHFVGMAEGEPIGALRTAGLDAAGGDVVRILEDGCPPAPGWIDPLAAALRRGVETAGAAAYAGAPAGGASDASTSKP